VDPADPKLPPIRPGTLADVLEGAAAEAAMLEALPLHPSLVAPAPARQPRQRQVLQARRTIGNVVYLHRPPVPPSIPGGSAA
jgi:hypothetical protein